MKFWIFDRVRRSLQSPPLSRPPCILTTRLLFQAHLSQPQEVVLSSPANLDLRELRQLDREFYTQGQTHPLLWRHPPSQWRFLPDD